MKYIMMIIAVMCLSACVNTSVLSQGLINTTDRYANSYSQPQWMQEPDFVRARLHAKQLTSPQYHSAYGLIQGDTFRLQQLYSGY